MKNLIIVTGGSGFVGSNLIKHFLKKTNYNIISIDNYSSGSKKNHITNSRVVYKNSETKNISKIIKNPKEIDALFHFGEFSRIYQSFVSFDQCIESNNIGTNSIISFCLKYNIRLIYSATSASLGNNGNDKNLSPYAFTKSQNLELLENLKKWFKFKYEIVYFYNVYGPRQISKGSMATVVGIFQDYYLKNKKLPVVRPGTQSRRFTHVQDTINTCYEAWKFNKNKHYSISSKKSYSILQLAKMFNTELKFLPPRKGERYASALNKMNLNNKINQRYGKIDLKQYIEQFIKRKN